MQKHRIEILVLIGNSIGIFLITWFFNMLPPSFGRPGGVQSVKYMMAWLCLVGVLLLARVAYLFIKNKPAEAAESSPPPMYVTFRGR